MCFFFLQFLNFWSVCLSLQQGCSAAASATLQLLGVMCGREKTVKERKREWPSEECVWVGLWVKWNFWIIISNTEKWRELYGPPCISGRMSILSPSTPSNLTRIPSSLIKILPFFIWKLNQKQRPRPFFLLSAKVMLSSSGACMHSLVDLYGFVSSCFLLGITYFGYSHRGLYHVIKLH